MDIVIFSILYNREESFVSRGTISIFSIKEEASCVTLSTSTNTLSISFGIVLFVEHAQTIKANNIIIFITFIIYFLIRGYDNSIASLKYN